MATLSRIMSTPEDLNLFVRLLWQRKLPFTVVVRDGKHRTNAQNSLQHKWYQEAAEQLGEYDAGEYKNRCKLRFGVPILRGTSEDFNEMWERSVDALTHEAKVEMMEYLQVTSLMTTKEKKQYLDAVQRFFLERGVLLTDPEERK